ncbi:hypothetical protein [Burkholderia gladioli]|uniref:hypothetical protein n=1 Tax=Burkholderia gladioli TaxID=28095 RepID=UPI00265612FC|nr:hypothetical protein [Burkholderia gladioli]MDN7717793.1 hypothetical protein [Burkholderia gladioli]
MKSIKLSPFAMSNIQSMTRDQARSVKQAIEKLRAGGIHSEALEVSRLPSKQGYVVRAKSGTRLTVVHEGGGNLLVDDVFVSTSSAGEKPASSSPRKQGRAAVHLRTSTKKATAKKAAAAKKA